MEFETILNNVMMVMKFLEMDAVKTVLLNQVLNVLILHLLKCLINPIIVMEIMIIYVEMVN